MYECQASFDALFSLTRCVMPLTLNLRAARPCDGLTFRRPVRPRCLLDHSVHAVEFIHVLLGENAVRQIFGRHL